MSTLGERIKQLRIGRHLTQAQLGDKLGLAKNTISLYESDKRRPSYDILDMISDFFNVDTNFLLGKEDVTTRLLTYDEINLVDTYRSGKLKTSFLTTTESLLIEGFRSCTIERQNIILELVGVKREEAEDHE